MCGMKVVLTKKKWCLNCVEDLTKKNCVDDDMDD